MSQSQPDTGDATAGSAGHVEFVRVRVAGEAYAVETGRVRHLAHDPAITRVPRAPGTIAGVTDVHGVVTAAIDGRALVGVDPAPAGDSPVLVVFARTETDQGAGLLVDAVDGLRTVAVDRIRPPDHLDAGATGPFLAIVDEMDEGATVMPVFDPDRVIAAASAG